jgi:hypothetical protein
MNSPFLRKYGVQTTINFVLYETDGIDLKVDAVHASGDTKIMKDEGTEANTANGFTDEGQGYSLVLSSTEMQAARIVIYIVDQGTKAWLDTVIVIETYGHASAQHPFLLATSPANTVDVDTSGNINANVVQISGDSTAANNLESDYDGTGYNKSNSTIGTCTTNTDMVSEPPSAANVADAVWDEAKAGHVGAGSFGEEVQSHALSSEISALNDLTAQEVRDAMKLPPTGGAPAVGSIDEHLDDVLDDTGTSGVQVADKTGYSLAADQSGVTIGTCNTNTDMVSEPPSATIVADAVWDEAKSGHVAAGSFGEEVQSHALSSEILALNDPTAAEIRAEMDSNSTQLAKIDNLILDMARLLGLSYENAYQHTRSYSGGKLMSVKLDIYDSKANAQAHDGFTGIVAKYTQTFTYSGDELASMQIVRDS